MKKSEEQIPLGASASTVLGDKDFLQKAWQEGWLDEFSEDHFLIKAIENRLNDFQGRLQLNINDIHIYPTDNFQEIFCINFSNRMNNLLRFFGEDAIKEFVMSQLSAGKEKYDEGQFFRALSEISILSFWLQRSKSGQYEPTTNGDKNPEARFECVNGVTVDVEVKTGGFEDISTIRNMAIPAVLLDDEGRKEFLEYCGNNSIHGYMPRVLKLKDLLNSAAEKFERVDHVNHVNLLYINWTFSEFIDSGFEEAFSLFVNLENGILTHKEIGISLGISEEVYDKITAVVVYTESLEGLMFGDFRWVWTRGNVGMPHFGIVGMHGCDGLFEITGMNPYAIRQTPILLAYLKDSKHTNSLMDIIAKHMLKAW